LKARQGRYSEAIGNYQKAVALRASMPGLRTNLAMLYLADALMRLNRQEGALRELLQAEALRPEEVSAHYRLGSLYRAMDKTMESNAEMAKSKTLNKAADERLLFYKRFLRRIPKARRGEKWEIEESCGGKFSHLEGGDCDQGAERIK
jgi:tetratricopeptide (TPR) repeat protein